MAVQLTEISQKLGTNRHGLRRAFRIYLEQHDTPSSTERRVHRQQEHERHIAA